MICPLLSAKGHPEGYKDCMEEECAWWKPGSSEEEGCAVLVIADELRHQLSNIACSIGDA